MRCFLFLAASSLSSASLAAPLYPPFGLDLNAPDRTVKPGDDFFQYANGSYLSRATIPADRPIVSRRLDMTDRTEGQLHSILEEAARSTSAAPTDLKGKVGAFYAAFMDEQAVERVGVKAIAPELDAIRTAPDKAALARLMGHSADSFMPSPIGANIDSDLKAPDHYAVYVGQSGLGLPDRDYYLKPDLAKQRTAYRDYAATLLGLENWPSPSAAADAAIVFETALAQASWTKVQQRDLTTQYHPMSPTELSRAAPGFAWSEYLKGAGLAAKGRLVITQDTALPKIAVLVAATPIDTLKAWMAFRVADSAAPYLSKPFVDARFKMRDQVLVGQKAQKARWKRAILAVGGGDCGVAPETCFGTLNWGVGELYSARYFPPATKARISALVADVKAAFRARMTRLDWMGPATKTEALAKLDTYVVKVGYPDTWRDYSKVAVRRDDLVGNVRSAATADWAFYVGRSDGPVDRGDWLMTPQTNDAYNGSLRDIVFPAGILQAPMFDADADPAINYGAIGGVIGHEMTHGFDDQGRSIDAKGALRDWWTPADAAAFKARAAVLGQQYAAFEPVQGTHINPDLTMGENLADLGGLSIALEAYHRSLNGKLAPVIGGLSGDQRVFLGWAQDWAGKATPEEIRRLTTSDPHSYRKYRVNGVVRNIDDWYRAFGAKPGDALFVPPEKRARVW